MTSLLSWVGVDQRGPSSLYLAADSRITWANGNHWDHGRKVFASPRYPEMFGYCGDAFFPTHALSQIIEAINVGMLKDIEERPMEKAARVSSVLVRSLRTYPMRQSFNFDLLYCTRKGESRASIFHVFRLSFQLGELQRLEELSLSNKSGPVAILGSGTTPVQRSLNAWQESDVNETSRAMFAAFCDAIRSKQDPRTGGIPQLTALYRIGEARTCGIVYQGSRAICGIDPQSPACADGIKWFNELFERCDGSTGNRRDDAKPQPRPKDL